MLDAVNCGMSLTELLPSLRELPAAEKLRLIRILAEEVAADVSPIDPRGAYIVATPTFEPGAAETLMRELQIASRG